MKRRASPAGKPKHFRYDLVPKCLAEATIAALMSYLTPILFLNASRPGQSKHKVKIHLVHETAVALAVFQYLLMHPVLLARNYDVRWEHQLKPARGKNIPRADLFLSPQRGRGGRKTWIEIGDVAAEKVRIDAGKLLKERRSDSLFLLALERRPPAKRQSDDDMHKRMLKATQQPVHRRWQLTTHRKACKLLTIPVSTGIDDDGQLSYPRIGFGLLKLTKKSGKHSARPKNR